MTNLYVTTSDLVKKMILLLCFVPGYLMVAQEKMLITDAYNKSGFLLTDCNILYDESDFEVVKKTAILLAEDIKSVSGYKPRAVSQNTKGNVIILGTLGKNRMIDKLVSEGELEVSGIRGGWEQFIIKRLQNPLPGLKQALVVVGSDRRGTAYGAFTLSEAMGVSPWVWWADVPVKRRKRMYVVEDYISKTPSVKYRGIFINDEDWGLQPWAAQNYEKELGDIGPKTYEKVCELLLRLKANMLAPAMHNCTGAFYYYDQSKIVADRYGIIVTTSHCEPLLFNNTVETEWDINRDGDWNYATNRETIKQKLNNRVREAYPYENIYTMGIRGIHDEGMRGDMSVEEKVNILGQVIVDQQSILKSYINEPLEDIPQIFVPYKETLDLYNNGVKVPENITLIWTDDNFGYIKRLSNPEEKQRKGGAGVYYHTSYLGPPHDYLWLCTTPPVLMYEELKKAYATGADKYWLLNVGDIKPAELGTQTFFDLAWDMNRYNYQNINMHQSRFLSAIFGSGYEDKFQDILDTHYRLAWSRKPEFMGWEREWDTPQYTEIADTDFSFQNYNDAQQRLADYKRISDATREILQELPEAYRPAFYELLAYPVQGAYQMNRKFLMAQLNHEKLKENKQAEANWAATQSQKAYDSINLLNKKYNTMLNGKWNGMMMIAPGFVAKYQGMPALYYTEGAGNKEVNLDPLPGGNSLEGCMVLDVTKYTGKIDKDGHTLRVIRGIGYDWESVQLGEAVEEPADPSDLRGSRFEYEFSTGVTDSITVYVYTIPFFPLYNGRSTRFGISVDGQPAYISKNEPHEFSKAWKDQVLKNGVVAVAKFPVDRDVEKHTLSLICGDPGTIIQRVIIDWGGLKPSYTGPSLPD